MQTLGIYRLVPIAPPDDDRWDLSPSQGEVVVRALSPADARIVASAAEADFMDVAAKTGDGVTTSNASAFRNEGLYAVEEVTDGSFARAGERGVVEGHIDPRVIRPLEAD